MPNTEYTEYYNLTIQHKDTGESVEVLDLADFDLLKEANWPFVCGAVLGVIARHKSGEPPEKAPLHRTRYAVMKNEWETECSEDGSPEGEHVHWDILKIENGLATDDDIAGFYHTEEEARERLP